MTEAAERYPSPYPGLEAQPIVLKSWKEVTMLAKS
jgi:hypothetical protein